MLRPLALLAALALTAPAFAAGAVPGDADKDGTTDLQEARSAAAAEFDKLDADHDGTLDAKELKRRIVKKDWPAADPDKDKTVSRDEYFNYVDALFKVADRDGDGTLDAKEMRSKAGRKLQKLMK
jgi:Ca2+-binding EF-hand superfamily protein